ncbi:MAG TPA: ABC transporter substrate-binding protein [Micromonosporaceae bacterium]|nr:ABC transporter substrate-binding protein [Micromonosporaceae bacterium]
MTSQRSNARRAILLAAASLLVLAACGTTKKTADQNLKAVGYGNLPSQSGTPQAGGTITFSQSPGADPNWIFPITPAANSSVYVAYQFQNLMWRPLYWAPKGSSPQIDDALSLAAEPSKSADGKTFTIKLNGQYKWSDGQPVTSADILFFIDIYRAAVKENPSNVGNYTPGQFPDNVTSAVAVDQNTVTLTFDKVYNPEWVFLSEIGQIVPIPSHAWAITKTGGSQVDYTDPANAKAIYDYFVTQSKDLKSYASNPLWQMVDGPFKISSYNANTGAANFTANAAYAGPNKPHIAELDELAYTSTTAEFNDLRSGKLDVGFVDPSDIPQVPALQKQGFNVYGLPDFGFNYIAFNFKDTTGHWSDIVKQLYVRQAIAHLQDEAGVISGLYKGAAFEAYGPVPAQPVSPFAPANAKQNPYPFSIDAAKQLLTSHGWTVNPGGTTTCTSAGSGPSQCGDGIPAGTPLTFNIVYSNSPAVIGQQVNAIQSAAKQVGITINTVPKTFNFIVENYGVPEAPANNNQWAAEDFGGFSEGLYPSTNDLFNTGGSFNQGGYSDPTMDQLISNSINGTDPQAVQKEAAYVTQQLPGIFQPNPDLIWAWKNTISGPPDGFANMTQYVITPEMWFLKQ